MTASATVETSAEVPAPRRLAVESEARDLTTLVRQGVLERASAPRVVSVVFIVMGVLLAGVGSTTSALWGCRSRSSHC